jgi:hypothetical protein
VFTANIGGMQGGAVSNQSASPVINACSFSGNVAHDAGGGMCNQGGAPVIDGCSFTNNDADPDRTGRGLGGAILNYDGAAPVVSACM